MRETIFRLSDTSGALGLACGNGGVALAGVPLLKPGAGGFEARSRAKIETLVGHAYGEGIDATKLIAGLGVVAKSLNKGDLPLAMIAAVLLKLPDLDWDGAVRIAQADAMLAKFDPDQPRDSRGRWTDAGGSASPGGFAPKKTSSRRRPGRRPGGLILFCSVRVCRRGYARYRKASSRCLGRKFRE